MAHAYRAAAEQKGTVLREVGTPNGHWSTRTGLRSLPRNHFRSIQQRVALRELSAHTGVARHRRTGAPSRRATRKQVHLTGREHSRQTLEHSQSAHQRTQDAWTGQGIYISNFCETTAMTHERGVAGGCPEIHRRWNVLALKIHCVPANQGACLRKLSGGGLDSLNHRQRHRSAPVRRQQSELGFAPSDPRSALCA